jgi:hypothetical protein
VRKKRLCRKFNLRFLRSALNAQPIKRFCAGLRQRERILISSLQRSLSKLLLRDPYQKDFPQVTELERGLRGRSDLCKLKNAIKVARSGTTVLMMLLIKEQSAPGETLSCAIPRWSGVCAE